MTRTKDPFPKQGRYLRTNDPIEHDPLAIALAQREAREAEIREAVANGRTPQADPQDLRGIPVQAQGVGGTSPGTSPHGKAESGRMDDHRCAA